MQGALRQLLRGCSRPLSTHDNDMEECKGILPESDLVEYFSPSRYGSMSVMHLRTAVELHAIFRHLQVRWQLFSEALSRYRDVDSMLAMCTDDVVWSKYLSDNLVSSNISQLSQYMQTLIAKGFTLTVLVERVTKVCPSGAVDLSLNQNGHFGKLRSRDFRKAQAALEHLSSYRIREGVLGSELGSTCVVLEQDKYTLHNERGIVLEEGSRQVLWEQHHAAWYVRACISCPD